MEIFEGLISALVVVALYLIFEELREIKNAIKK